GPSKTACTVQSRRPAGSGAANQARAPRRSATRSDNFRWSETPGSNRRNNDPSEDAVFSTPSARTSSAAAPKYRAARLARSSSRAENRTTRPASPMGTIWGKEAGAVLVTVDARKTGNAQLRPCPREGQGAPDCGPFTRDARCDIELYRSVNR